MWSVGITRLTATAPAAGGSHGQSCDRRRPALHPIPIPSFAPMLTSMLCCCHGAPLLVRIPKATPTTSTTPVREPCLSSFPDSAHTRNEPLLLLEWACVSVSVMLLEMHRVWLQWFVWAARCRKGTAICGWRVSDTLVLAVRRLILTGVFWLSAMPYLSAALCF